MHITDVASLHRPTISFEFFPPKSETGADALLEAVKELEPLKPSFVSMTYGAGGSTRDLTHDLVMRLKRETSVDPVPHLTCVCHSEAEIRSIVERYAAAGVSNILALGGDPPKNLVNYDRSADHFQHAEDLVRFIQRFNAEKTHPNPKGFGIGVAGFPEGHPATPNRLVEMDHLKAKVDAGADFIITQLCFDNHDFFDFCERCEIAGIKVPVIAGIMPVQSLEHMTRMSELALGARYPAKLMKAVQRCGSDKAAISRVGIHWATQQCLALLDAGIRGLHFYTLNKSKATLEIYRSLGVMDSEALQSPGGN